MARLICVLAALRRIWDISETVPFACRVEYLTLGVHLELFLLRVVLDI